MKKKPPEQPQKDKFIAAAKEHGCSESEKEFSAKLRKITPSTSKKKD